MSKTSNIKTSFPAVMNTRDLNGKNGISVATLPELALGGGFSSDREMPAYHSCVNAAKIQYIPNTDGNIALSTTQNFNLFEKSLSKGWKESLSIGNFSQSASEEYVHHVTQTDYSISYYFVQTFNLPGAKIILDGGRTKALNQFGKDYYGDGQGDNPNMFRKICGDRYLSEAKLSGGLFAAIKLVFNSIDDKKNYTTEAAVGYKFGVILDVSRSVKEITNKYHLNVNVEVSAYQVGGAPWEMGGIFQNGGTSAFSWTPCTRDTFDKCQSVINGVLEYSAKTFSQQFKMATAEDVFKVGHLSGYVLPTYEEALDLKIGDTIIDDKITTSRIQLGSLYSNFKNEQAFIKHVLASSIFNSNPSSFPNDDKNKIQKIADNLDFNIKLLENDYTGAIACYKQPQDCVNTFNKINSTLIPVDENYINQIKNSYEFTAAVCYNHICWPKPKAKGEAVAIPTDNQGHFRWEYSNYNNNLTIIKNNDGTIALSINGGQPSIMTNDGHGHYQGYVHCLQDNDSAPHPLNTYCDKTDHSGVYTTVDLVLESIYDMY